MPADAPAVKQAAVAAYGAQIHLCTPTLAGRAEAVARLRAQMGACYIPPFNHPDIIAGQGTVALELLQAHPDLDALVLPVGGGGLTWAAPSPARMRPGPRARGRAYRRQRRRPQQAGGRPAPAPGSRAPQRGRRAGPGPRLTGPACAIGWRPCWRSKTAAMRLLASRMKLVVEPSGAIGLAAVLSGRLPLRGARIGVVLSGGNVDLAQLGADAP